MKLRVELRRQNEFWEEISRRAPSLVEAFSNSPLVEKLSNFQVQAASSFGPDPIEFLEAFEALEDGPWKTHVWETHKLTLQICMKERAWRKTVAESKRIQQTHQLAPGSYGAQLQEITDPAQKSAFLREHKAEIEAEVFAVQREASRLRNNSLMGEPATL